MYRVYYSNDNCTLLHSLLHTFQTPPPATHIVVVVLKCVWLLCYLCEYVHTRKARAHARFPCPGRYILISQVASFLLFAQPETLQSFNENMRPRAFDDVCAPREKRRSGWRVGRVQRQPEGPLKLSSALCGFATGANNRNATVFLSACYVDCLVVAGFLCAREVSIPPPLHF